MPPMVLQERWLFAVYCCNILAPLEACIGYRRDHNGVFQDVSSDSARGATRGEPGCSCRRLAQASYGVACDVGDYWKSNASWKKLLQFVVHIYLHSVA